MVGRAIMERRDLPLMASKPDPDLGINSWLEEELYQEYLHDHGAVDESWKEMFQNAPPATAPASAAAAVPAPAPIPSDTSGELVPLKGAAARIAQNMAASASVPLATS